MRSPIVPGLRPSNASPEIFLMRAAKSSAVMSGEEWPSALGTVGAGFGGAAGCVDVCGGGAGSCLPQAARVRASVAKSASCGWRMLDSGIDLDLDDSGMGEFLAPSLFPSPASRERVG